MSQDETIITAILPFAKLSTSWKWQMVQIGPVWNCYLKYMPGNSTKVFSSDRSIQKLEASSIGRRRKIPICISWNPKNWGAWNVHYGNFNCRISRHNIFLNEFKAYISIIIFLTLQKFGHPLKSWFSSLKTPQLNSPRCTSTWKVNFLFCVSKRENS